MTQKCIPYFPSCHSFTLSLSHFPILLLQPTWTLLKPQLIQIQWQSDITLLKAITLSQSSGLTPSTVTVSSWALSTNLWTASSGDEAVDTVTGTSHWVLLPALVSIHYLTGVWHNIKLSWQLCLSYLGSGHEQLWPRASPGDGHVHPTFARLFLRLMQIQWVFTGGGNRESQVWSFELEWNFSDCLFCNCCETKWSTDCRTELAVNEPDLLPGV